MQLSFSSFLTFSFQEAGDSFCSGLSGSEVAEAGWIRSSEAELAWKNSEHFRRPLNHLTGKGIAQSSPRKTETTKKLFLRVILTSDFYMH